VVTNPHRNSQSAARSVEGHAPASRAHVWRLIRDSPNGLACWEVEQMTGGLHQSVSATINWLRNHGALTVSGRRNKTPSDRWADIYLARTKAEAEAGGPATGIGIGIGGTVEEAHAGPDGTRVIDKVRLTSVSVSPLRSGAPARERPEWRCKQCKMAISVTVSLDPEIGTGKCIYCKWSGIVRRGE
jgi:hypothetical protein